jgi:hypothetical protein
MALTKITSVKIWSMVFICLPNVRRQPCAKRIGWTAWLALFFYVPVFWLLGHVNDSIAGAVKC